MKLHGTVLLLLVTAGVITAFQPKSPQITRLTPLGINIAYPSEAVVSAVTIHFNINKPLHGIDAGQYSINLIKDSGNWWRYTDMGIALNARDTVNLRLDVTYKGKLYSLKDQSWRAIDAEEQANTCSTYPCVIFEDNFDKLDLNVWQHEITAGGGGNWEFQHYTNNRSNSYVRDGNLYLKPTLTEDKYGGGFLSSGVLEIWGKSPADLCTGNQFYGCRRQGTATNYINPIQSARIRSVYSFSFRYGRIEIEAKLPQGDWIWPALWLLPTNQYYAGWPSSGEVDIMESRGNRGLRDQSGNSQGVDKASSTLHWGPYGGQNKYYLTTGHKYASSGNFGTSFHKYRMDWDETEMKFYIDDDQILRVDPGPGGFWEFGGFNNSNLQNPWSGQGKMAPFDKEFNIVMNVAVGGTNGFFSDSHINDGYQKPWSNTSPTGPRDFWLAKDKWYPTWNPTTNNGEDAAMAINYVRVTKLKPDPQ